MLRYVVAGLTCISLAGACGADPQPQVSKNKDTETASTSPSALEPASPPASPLPMPIPIGAVMAGIVNESSFAVFRAATADQELTEADWLRIGSAAIDLVGASTLVTIPGTGPDDEAWVSDPQWMQASADMQEASMAVGRAANAQDAAALRDATAQLAQSCQSCHIVFSPRLVGATTGQSD